jgi:hypothetical protein
VSTRKGKGRGAGSKTHHFIGENTVDTVIMETAHPVETLNLVLTHLTTLDDCESGCISQARGAEKERTEAKKERTSRRLSEHEWSLDLLLALALKQLVVLLLLALRRSPCSSFPSSSIRRSPPRRGERRNRGHVAP